MEKVIYKYYLHRGDLSVTVLSLPISTELLTIEVQDKDIVIWVIQPMKILSREYRTIISIPTGSSYEEKENEYYKYINTITDKNGLVYHYFEIIKS